MGWRQSVNTLSEAELEALIRQRRGQIPPIPAKNPVNVRAVRPRKRWEKALFGAEILALIAILLVTGISARGWLAIRQKLPLDGITLAAQPVQASTGPAQVLPPPGWRNQPMANQSAPAPIRPLDPPARIQQWLRPNNAVPAIAVPKTEVKQATRILIPSINVDAPVGEGTDWESLKYRVGHHPGTANPGQRGNMVLAAHNDVYGELFRYLPDVPVGEIITVYAGDETFRYKITQRRIITPDQVEVMLPTTGPTVTLISCYPYLIDTHRIVLFGELVS